jgi:SAM-dependent methyltransferase
MALAEYIARQASRPRGLFGRLLAQIWVFESAAANGAALDLLGIEPTDRILEIGFGHGRTIQRAAARAGRGFVAGVDPSELMVSVARRRNRRLLREGRVDLGRADVAKLPFPDGSFDKVFSVHTIYFWKDPLGTLEEIRRVLRPGGRLVLGFRARDDGAPADRYPPSIYTFHSREEVRSMLEASGYGAVRVEGIPRSGNAPSWAIATRSG